MSNNYIVDLENEINDINNKINSKSTYNIKNTIIRNVIKSGITIEYLLPYILSSIIVFQSFSMLGNRPFIKDIIIDEEHKELVRTSTDLEIENTSYDNDYNEDSVEYTTAWYKNDFDLFQRDIIKYKMKNDFDLDYILKLTKEELNKLFVVEDRQSIYKEKLDDLDKMYDTNMIIVTREMESDNLRTREESIDEVINHSLLSSVVIVALGFGLGMVRNKTYNTYIRDRLNNKLYQYRKITPDEVGELKKILEIKQKNLDYINNDNKEKKHILHKDMM